MNRRSFLTLPALAPFVRFASSFRNEEHHFQYEGVLGTSMDLVIWAPVGVAERACQTVLAEIDRLASILNSREPASEISRFPDNPSRELQDVLDAYAFWEQQTRGVFSIHPAGANTPRNVDALGKAYIIDRSAMAAREACPSIDGLLLNIGGDIVVWGRPCDIAIADPAAPHDNGAPLTTVALQNAAIATSGMYARGPHLVNARNGQAPGMDIAATVIARDAVTANALATTLCLTETERGLQLVESTRGAEALRVSSSAVHRTSGFSRFERRGSLQTLKGAWPEGYQLTIALPLTMGRSRNRPYVAVWVEDASGRLVKILAFWGSNSKYQKDLSAIWNLAKKTQIQLRSVSRATRPAGKYDVVWDGHDDEAKPVAFGAYRIVVETDQEHGTYAKQAGAITLGEGPTSITIPATTNFEPVVVNYGPK